MTNNKQSKETIIEEYLSNNYDFRYNEIRQRVEFRDNGVENFKLLGERETKSLIREIRASIKQKISDTDLNNILKSDFSPSYNPFTDYFESLPECNNEESHIDKLIRTLDAHNIDFIRWSFPRWLIAVVASMLESKVCNHEVPILAGKQSMGKSTWIRNLVPNKLKEYFYSGTISGSNRDTLMLMHSSMLIDLDELSNLDQSKSKELKELITKDSLTLRVPYGRNAETFTRNASFIASTNENEFLYDLTGSRRFLCFDLISIDYKTSIDMDSVWAEAYSLYLNKEKFWFEKDDIVKIEKNNEGFKSISPFEKKLKKLFTYPTDGNFSFHAWLDLNDIYKYIHGKDLEYHSDAIKLGKVLVNIGCKKERNTIDKERKHRYHVALNTETIFQEAKFIELQELIVKTYNSNTNKLLSYKDIEEKFTC